MLKRLYVDNFRCLTNFEFRPAPVSVLVGPNGGGKSTVLEILRCLQALLTTGQETKEVFPISSVTRWDQRLVQRIELEAVVNASQFAYSLTVQQEPARGESRLVEERLTSDGQLLYRVVDSQVELFGDDPAPNPRTSFPFVATRSFLPLLEPRPDNTRITAFKRWLSGIWLFALRPDQMELVAQAEARALLASGANLVAWYRALAQEYPEIVTQVRDDLGPVIPGLRNLRLRDFGPGAKVMAFVCEVSGREFDLVLNELSEGQRALVVLYTILRAIAGRASVLVFDEPDNFVAHAEIQPWLSLLRDVCIDAGGRTLLVISHHPEVVDYLAVDQALYMWRGADGPTRVRELEVDRGSGQLASELLRFGPSHAE